MGRLGLQLINGLVAVATIALASVQLGLGVQSPIYSGAQLPAFPILDSNLRFFGGMGLGLALAMLWALSTIERQAVIVRVFWLCAFLGGSGRLISALMVGAPSRLLVGFTVLEVVGAPIIVYWHLRVSKALASDV